jgi:hypothetical protein
MIGDDGGMSDYILWFSKMNVLYINLRALLLNYLSFQKKMGKYIKLNLEEK